MMKQKTRHLLVDVNNIMFRARYGVENSDNPDDIVGMCKHVFLTMLSKAFNLFDVDHLVLAVDSGSSWRKEVFPDYKIQRKLKTKPIDKIIQRSIIETIDDMMTFMDTKTNASVLRCPMVEGDDFIAQWIFAHPDHHHIILSSDSDYKQLVNDSVHLYDGMKLTLYTLEGEFLSDGIRPRKGQPVEDYYGKKWKQKLDDALKPVVFDPEWLLFEKIMRGDVSDSIPRAAPKGIRTTKLIEAYESGSVTSQPWLQLMSNIHPDNETVLDKYERNKELIDLRYPPEPILEAISEIMAEQMTKQPAKQIGFSFLQYCRENGLLNIQKQARYYGKILGSSYV